MSALLPFTWIWKSTTLSPLTSPWTRVFVPSKKARSSPAWPEKAVGANELEALRAGHERIGVDLRQIDLVAAVAKPQMTSQSSPTFELEMEL